jgi:pilus assembly protein CpaE
VLPELVVTEGAMSNVEDVMSGKVITFMKSGGGVGATTLAVQAACSLRGANLALLDLDIQYGSAAFQMDAESNASILDLVATPDRIDAALLQGAMVRPHDAFDLLAAPEGIYPMEDVSVAAVDKVIEVARSVYATILIDLPMIWNEWGHAAIRNSDQIVLVTSMTIPSLRQARRQIEMMHRELLGNIPLFVVANRVIGGFLRKGLSQKAGEKALGRPINFIIPNDPLIATAADAGLPLRDVKGSALAKKLVRMMEEVFVAGEPSRLAVEA